MIVPDGADHFGYPVIDLPQSACSSPEAAVKFLVGQLVESGRLRPENANRVACQVLYRESLGSTAIGRGFALPHAKSDVVGEVLGIVGRSTAPVKWPGGLDAETVRVVCLLVTPTSEPGTSLRALEVVSRRMRGG
jgi:mannitol/fructose-specific phosphotransferase system IIA component (Ntr-type)